ncbi:FAD:protein FMN transferase [Paenibacillus doosanensis]|uniref:FAD:protein FMN transferase n=1 Tax=Paenibacillus doosanensis TaxID=1229154 RepID=UPI00218069F0|nr:FAD:protein FMN transferase [Paenibacillus doosanensis]MCS7461503.1 FAD:protein FMN transferase [Paenibacillus doosanensis]
MKKTKLYMDTVVDIQVVAEGAKESLAVERSMDRAFEMFRQVELACSRFDPDSELMRACRHVETSVKISPFLFEPLKFALEIAEWTNGVFDPTVGKLMEERGFNRRYLTGDIVDSTASGSATFRDIVLNELEQTICLLQPAVLDLGAVAKGFAIDLAAKELSCFPGFLINAGGDIYAGGQDESAEPWTVGIRHPLNRQDVIYTVSMSNEAICTSGSYERKSPKEAGQHHLIHPQTKLSPSGLVSCSVIAPYAMLADALSTVSFLLGSDGARQLIEQEKLKGILINSSMQIIKAGEI